MISDFHPITENFVDGTGGLLRQIPKAMYGAPTVVGLAVFLSIMTTIKEVCLEIAVSVMNTNDRIMITLTSAIHL